jgi:hypothetical protein
MPTELYGNVDYARVAAAVKQIDSKTRRIRGVAFPDFQALPPIEKARRDAQIQKIASDCGCNVGAGIAVGVTLLYLGLVFAGALAWASTPVRNYLLAIPVFLGAAVVGKLIGLKRLQAQLQGLSHEIRAELLAQALVADQPETNP